MAAKMDVREKKNQKRTGRTNSSLLLAICLLLLLAACPFLLPILSASLQEYNETATVLTKEKVGTDKVLQTTTTLHLTTIDAAQQPFRSTNDEKSKNALRDDADFSPPVGEHASSRTECSCATRGGASSHSDCCLRGFLVVHKMGFMATYVLRKRYFPQIRIVGIAKNSLLSTADKDSHHQRYINPPMGEDYRMVVVTRNWYDALISGYLYHRAGRECWTDSWGNEYDKLAAGLTPNSTNAKETREKRGNDSLSHRRRRRSTSRRRGAEKKALNFTASMTSRRGSVAVSGRDLCGILNQLSESDGLRVYVDWALDANLSPLLEFARARREAESRDGFVRTLFVCYEQLYTLPESHAAAVQTVHDWFYPGEDQSDLTETVASLEKKYEGSHATDHDPEMRKRLVEIVMKLDKDHYYGMIAGGNSEFGCEGDYTT